MDKHTIHGFLFVDGTTRVIVQPADGPEFTLLVHAAAQDESVMRDMVPEDAERIRLECRIQERKDSLRA